jgi:hypothetical protein
MSVSTILPLFCEAASGIINRDPVLGNTNTAKPDPFKP